MRLSIIFFLKRSIYTPCCRICLATGAQTRFCSGSSLRGNLCLWICTPDPIVYFDAFGHIYHHRQTAVVSDQVWLSTKADKPVNLQRVGINRHQCACHGPQFADHKTRNPPAGYGFPFNVATEKVQTGCQIALSASSVSPIWRLSKIYEPCQPLDVTAPSLIAFSI